MEILIRLAGVQLGPYSETEARQHLTDGLLSLTDSAKSAGTEEWVTLAEVLAKALPPSLAAPTVALPALEDDSQPEQAIEEEPDAARRAPDAPPGVMHLPTRSQEQEPDDESLLSAQAKKTVLIGPNAPDISSSVGPTGASTVTTSPLAQSAQPRTKNPSRATLVKGLAQKTSPLPTRIIDPPAKPSAPPILEKPSFPAADEPRPKKEAPDALMRSLTAKTVPMRSTPPVPVSSMPVTTTPLPTKPVFKPNTPPPSVVDDLTKKLGQIEMVMPDPVQTSPPTLGQEVETKKRRRPSKTKEPTAEVAPPPDEPPVKSPVERKPRRILPGLIAAWGVLAALMLYYIWSPYHAAASLRSALNSGDTSGLNATIDFPALRASLKDQVKNQLGQSGGSDSAVLSIIDNSIDLYVTPGGISELVTKSDQLSKDDHDQLISPKVAAKILLALNSESPKSQGLASVSDFVIVRDEALFHLRFLGIGWKLYRIELRPDWLSSAAPGSTSLLLSPVVDTYMERGDARVVASDWNGAIASYTQVVAVDPHSSIAYNKRGNARLSNSDLEGAIKDYTQALTIDPEMASAYSNRGNAKAIKNDLDGAITDYTQAIRIDPTLAAAYDGRGNAKTAKGDDLDGAIADFTQSITLDPNRASAYSDRGFARQASGNLDGAINDYTQALALAPKTAIAYYNRGLARQAQGNLESAIHDFDHALEFDPTISGAYFYRGNAKSATHDLDGAIVDYTKAIELNPKIAMAYSNRGLARQANGDLDNAVSDFTKALAIDPKIVTAYFNRGVIEAQKNDLDGAIADSSKALDLDPKNCPALYTRGVANLIKGSLDGAAADLKQFCDLAPRDRNADHARLYLWLINKGHNPGTDADPQLSDALENSWNSSPDDLLSKTAALLLGRLSEADYLSAAASTDAKTDAAQHCLAWYFAGMKRLLAGDKNGAIDACHRSVATGEKDVSEYLLAQAALQTLDMPPPAASAPATIQVPSPPTTPPGPSMSPVPAPSP